LFLPYVSDLKFKDIISITLDLMPLRNDRAFVIKILSIQLLNSKRYAKGVTFVYIVVFSLDYEIWMDSKQAVLYQIDRASVGGSIILKVKYVSTPVKISVRVQGVRFPV